MSQYCPAGHRIDYIRCKNCSLCTKESFIKEFKTWSSGNANINKIIQESQINQINHIYNRLHWLPYDNFQNIEQIADGGRGSVYSAKLENGIKWNWNFIKQDWEYYLKGGKVALKEIKDSRINIVESLKLILKTIIDLEYIPYYYGISKNPSTQNYIIVTNLLSSGLESIHVKNLVHCNLHSGNILASEYGEIFVDIDLDLGNFENDLILNSNKNNQIYGSIPYIPPEVLRGNKFTRKGDIYSFGGIMYEIVTAKRPFSDQAHDTYLMIDICNGLRPKVPDFMLNWIPEWYLDLMYRCWSDDPSERPTAIELADLFWEAYENHSSNIVNDDVMQQLKIADENQKNTSKSQKQELFELFLHSSKLHPQSCYIGRYIHTLHGLHDLLEEIKSGKSSDPNLLKPLF
ncbi:hypothetical protein Glove_155g99 [Diversispora epigaea]|uniref:Protein kinase domain-containing protein n=1 Tax=Diversispora epigaea TaxID=1348612 RepID=A0A397ISC0_9GLOM|nr:hypothetical protein Glove_155g99 [Diversispora epigaea]